MAHSSTSRRKSRGRAKPGSSGTGKFFHIQVRPRGQFKSFRSQDVGRRGGIERVAGRRASGTWDTQKWLIAKTHARKDGGELVADTVAAKRLLKQLGSKPRHLGGDRFRARPRPNLPERRKPTAAMRRAQRKNIKKAQAARRHTSRRKTTRRA